jgi:peptidoglycan/xylan/chitin deacetylase (PgdA/CDA1 family)
MPSRVLVFAEEAAGPAYPDPNGSNADQQGEGRAGILMYHRVVMLEKGRPDPLLNVEPGRFRKQLEGLMAMGYPPWLLLRLIQHHQEGLSPPRKVFVVTFDDGYATLRQNAWPIMADLAVLATVFLATQRLSGDAPFAFDNLEAARSTDVSHDSWCPLTVEQIQEMATDGLVELAAHSHSHQDFHNQPLALAQDLRKCMQFLHKHFGIAMPTFAFPFGYTTPEMIQVVQDAGLPYTLNVDEGLANPAGSPFEWGCFEASQFCNAHTLSVCLSRGYNHVQRFLRGR